MEFDKKPVEGVAGAVGGDGVSPEKDMGKDTGVAAGGAGGGAGNEHDSHDTQSTAGKKRRGRKPKEKLAVDSLEWIADAPQEVEITVQGEGVPKPRKKRQSQKKMLDTKENLYQIFSVASVFAGDIWKLEPDEAELIAKPLDSILSRYNILDRAEKYGDTIALTVALAAVFLPRIIYTINERKERHNAKQKAEAVTGSGAGSATTSSSNSASSQDVLEGLFG